MGLWWKPHADYTASSLPSFALSSVGKICGHMTSISLVTVPPTVTSQSDNEFKSAAKYVLFFDSKALPDCVVSNIIMKLWIKINYDVKLGTNFVFITLQTSRWKIYATYCQNYDASEAYLKQKMKKKKEFCNFLNVSVTLRTKIM